jgi:hypothetical protein
LQEKEKKASSYANLVSVGRCNRARLTALWLAAGEAMHNKWLYTTWSAHFQLEDINELQPRTQQREPQEPGPRPWPLSSGSCQSQRHTREWGESKTGSWRQCFGPRHFETQGSHKVSLAYNSHRCSTDSRSLTFRTSHAWGFFFQGQP